MPTGNGLEKSLYKDLGEIKERNEEIVEIWTGKMVRKLMCKQHQIFYIVNVLCKADDLEGVF